MNARCSQDVEATSDGKTWVLGLLGVGIAAVVGTLAVKGVWKPWWDSAIYLDLSRSLLETGDYHHMGLPHTKYPPGYPVLLAFVTAFFGENHAVYRGVAVASAAVVAFLTPFLFRGRLGFFWLIPLCLLVAVSPALLFFQTLLLSDVPYAAISLAMTVLVIRRGVLPSTIRGGVLRGLLLLLCCVVRLCGISVVAAFVISATLHRDPERGWTRIKCFARASMVALPAVAFLMFWVARARWVDTEVPGSVREGVSYQREFFMKDAERGDSPVIYISGIARRVVDNVPYYVGLVGAVLGGSFNPVDDPLRCWVTILVPIGLALGFLGKLGRPGFLEWVLVTTLGLYLVWPAREDVRFLVPVIPLLLFYALSVPAVIVTRLARGRPAVGLLGAPALSLGLGFLVIAPTLFLSVREDLRIIGDERGAVYLSSGVLELKEIAEFLRDETPEGSRVVSDSAPWVHYWSRRPTFSYPWVHDPAVIYEGLRSMETDYVVVTSLQRDYLRDLVRVYENHPESFVIERVVGKSVLLRVVGW